MNKFLRYVVYSLLTLALLSLVACQWPWQKADDDATATPAGDLNTRGPGNTDGAPVVFIPGATFSMGSEDTQVVADGDEMPLHSVTLSSYFFYQHEVTNELYNACVDDGACAPVLELDGRTTEQTSNPLFAAHPVVGVSWNMARAYCEWAGVRLPTDAEWEYAARGTGALIYPWGTDDPDCNRTNMLGCSGSTAPVGSSPSGNSPFDAWDMAGNTFEWTYDWYADMYYHFGTPYFNPVGPTTYQDPDNPRKTVRGGSFLSRTTNLRTAARLGVDPFTIYNDVGFRCAESADFSLPEGYLGVGPGLTLGDTPEDPGTEWWYRIGHVTATCPDSANQIYIDVIYTATEGTTFALSVGGAPYTCTYDVPTLTQHCVGPAPADYAGPGPLNPVITLEYAPLGIVQTEILSITKPDDCTDADFHDAFGATAACPEGGSVDVTFTYDPTDVAWQFVTLRSMGVHLPCIVTGPGVMTCTAPDVSSGGFYEFYLYGENEEGLGRKRWPDVPVAEGCPGDEDTPVGAATACITVHPVLELSFDGDALGTVLDVTDSGAPAVSINNSPGVATVLFTDETPGRITSMHVCFSSGTCVDINDVTLPDCGSDDPGEVHHDSSINAVCYAPAGETVFNPAANIHFMPPDDDLVSAEAGGTPLSCTKMDDGWYVCSGLPGDPGDTTPVTFCLESGACFDETITVFDCPGGDEPPDEPAPWTFVSSGCHTGPEENIVFFMVDTGYPWLTPASSASYSATDGLRSFACVAHPSIPGRIYCYGLIPTEPGTLNLCIHQDGQPDDCQQFPDWQVWFNGLSCAAPTEEPLVPGQCQGLDQPTCTDAAHNDICRWVVPAATNLAPYCTHR